MSDTVTGPRGDCIATSHNLEQIHTYDGQLLRVVCSDCDRSWNTTERDTKKGGGHEPC